MNIIRLSKVIGVVEVIITLKELKEEEAERLTSTLRKCKANYIGQMEMSIIRALEDYIRDLEDYHGIEDVTLNKIMEKS